MDMNTVLFTTIIIMSVTAIFYCIMIIQEENELEKNQR